MTTNQREMARVLPSVRATRAAASTFHWLLRLLRPICIAVLLGATCLAGAPLQAKPRPNVLAVLPWHAETGLTPSLPSEANPQGPSALLRWRGVDWLLDTAGQRLVATSGDAVQPLPDGWWEDAVADGDALWLLSRLPLQRGSPVAPAFVGVVRWQAGRAIQRWPLTSAHTASALLPSPTGSRPWVEYLHRSAEPLAAQDSRHPTTRDRSPSPKPLRPQLTLVGAGPDRRVQLQEPRAALVALPASIRLIRDAGRLGDAVWWVWDDRDGTRWLSVLSGIGTHARRSSTQNDAEASHQAICKRVGPWQQLRVARVHEAKVRVVCPLAQGVVVVEVKP